MERIAILTQNIVAAVRKYYGMLLVALVATVAFILDIERNAGPHVDGIDDVYLKVGAIGLTGISLLFALHLAQQRYRIKWPLPLIGLLVLVGYYYWLPAGDVEQPTTLILLGVSAVSFHLAAAVVPFWKPADSDGFWDYNKNMFINTVQTAIFTVVLWGGLALAVLAVEHLFNLRVSNDFWGYLAMTVLIMGSSLVFALFAKGGFEALKTATPYPLVLKFFVQYVLIPLLIIYLLILYSYGIKIVVEWDLPQGWVSYLVLAYSFLGVLSLLLLYPLREVADKIWVRFFSRAFYITLVPLLVLLFVAIGIRIGDYGFTENRYYVLLLACWLLGITAYQLINRQNRIWIIPVSLLLVGYPTLWLPGLNVWSVSVNSQEHRLHRLLAEQQLLTAEGTIDFSRAVKRTALTGIADKMYYLSTRNQDSRVRRLVPPAQTEKADSILREDYLTRHHFENLFTHVIEDASRSTYTYLRPKRRGNSPVYTISSYDYLVPQVSLDYLGEFSLVADSLTLRVGVEMPAGAMDKKAGRTASEISLHLPAQDTVFRYNYAAYLDSVYNHYRDQVFSKPEIEADDLTVAFALGNYDAQIQFDQITFHARSGIQHPPAVRDSVETTATGTILIRKKPLHIR